MERIELIEKALADTNADEALLTMTADIDEERTPPEGKEEEKQVTSPSSSAPPTSAPATNSKGLWSVCCLD